MTTLFDDDEILEMYIEDVKNDVKNSEARETAKRFLKMGKLSFEEIANGTGLTVEEVKEIEAEVMQLA